MKRVIIIMTVMILADILGCGNREVRVEVESNQEQTEMQQFTEEVTKETVEEKEEIKEEIKEGTEGGVLAGVYSVGEELVEIPMGTYFEGEQRVFCTVKMPTNYRFGATCTLEGEKTGDVGEADGGNSLAFCIKRGLLEEPYAIDWALLGQGEDDIIFAIRPTVVRSMEDIKKDYPDFVEIGTQETPAFYYVDSSEYATEDVNMYISLNEHAGLSLSYEGPLAEELGLDQLARNIYDLVTVVE